MNIINMQHIEFLQFTYKVFSSRKQYPKQQNNSAAVVYMIN